MQQNAQLVSGKATLTSIQSLENGTHLVGDHRIQLGDLIANISGSPMKWEKPLSAVVKIEPTGQGSPSVTAECQSEFCELKASGDLLAG